MTAVPARGVQPGVGQQVGQHLAQAVVVADHEGVLEVVVLDGRSRRQSWSGPAACASVTASMASTVRSTGSEARGRPASSRASSSMSSSSAVIRRDSDSTRDIACSALTGISSGERRTSSAYPRIEASGVRSSWLASATNWRTCDSDSCRDAERLLDVPEQLVERGAHLADLGGGVGVLRRARGRRAPPRRGRGGAGRRGWRCRRPGRAGAARGARAPARRPRRPAGRSRRRPARRRRTW